jgi:hypothetical protein
MRITLSLIATLFAGCFSGEFLIGEIDPESIPEVPTYSEHVKPIMEYYCVACHYPGGEEPDLSTYEAVLDDFEETAEEVFESRSMPPGASRRLSPREETILARWAALEFPL